MRRAAQNHGVDLIERMVRLGAQMQRGDAMTARKIMDTFGVSWSTAKRDMNRLEAAMAVESQQTFSNLPRKITRAK